MYERSVEPLLSRRRFAWRVTKAFGFASAVIFGALGIGVVGYHAIAGLGWVDSLLEASMILTGMGPVAPLETTGAKLFASGYALFAGLAFLSGVGVLAAPLLHRVLHRLHLDLDAPDEEDEAERTCD